MANQRQQELSNQIHNFLMTVLTEEEKSEFTQEVSEILSDNLSFALVEANKVEKDLALSNDDLSDAKNYVCAVSRILEQQNKRPIYSAANTRTYNRDVKLIECKLHHIRLYSY